MKSNSEFLDNYLTKSPIERSKEGAILPLDKKLIAEKIPASKLCQKRRRTVPFVSFLGVRLTKTGHKFELVSHFSHPRYNVLDRHAQPSRAPKVTVVPRFYK